MIVTPKKTIVLSHTLLNKVRAWQLYELEIQTVDINTQSTAGVGSSSSKIVHHACKVVTETTSDCDRGYEWEQYDEGWWERGTPGNFKSCLVCAEDKPFGYFPLRSPTTKCEHEPGTCLDCMQTHIRTQIENSMVSEKSIRCSECSETLNVNEIQKYTDEDTFNL
jgi:hypothetical protein